MSSIAEAQRTMLEFVKDELGEGGMVIECMRRSDEEGGGWVGLVRTVQEGGERLRQAGQSDLLALYEIEVDDLMEVISYKRKFSRVGASPARRDATRRWRVQRVP